MPAREESNMFEKFRLERKIKKAVNKTVKELKNSIPKISEHFFYGAVELSPNNLVIWYLFKTNDELKLAKENGFIPVSLGEARLRTETAALVACHTIQLINQMK